MGIHGGPDRHLFGERTGTDHLQALWQGRGPPAAFRGKIPGLQPQGDGRDAGELFVVPPDRRAHLRLGGGGGGAGRRAAAHWRAVLFRRADGAAAFFRLLWFRAAADERHPLRLGWGLRRGQGGEALVYRHHPALPPWLAPRKGFPRWHPTGACFFRLPGETGCPAGRVPGRPPREIRGFGGAFRQREVHHRQPAHAVLRFRAGAYLAGGVGLHLFLAGGAAEAGDFGATVSKPVLRHHRGESSYGRSQRH